MNETEYHIGKNHSSHRNKTKTASSGDRRVHEMDEAGQRQLRSTKRPKEVCADESSSNGFLRTVFLPKIKEDGMSSQLSSRKKVKMERGFYKSLSQMSEHYQISQSPYRSFEFPYNISLSLYHSQKQIKKNVKNWQNIQLKQKGEMIYFLSEERCSTGMTLFYIPIVPLYRMLQNKSRRKTALLLLSVCTYFYKNLDIPYYRQENSYLFWLYEMLNDWIDQDEELGEESDYKRQLQIAEVIGDIMEQKISNINNLSAFENRLKSFNPKDDFDKMCLNLADKAFLLYNTFPEEHIYRNIYFNNNTELKDLEDYDNDEAVISMEKYISFFADDKGWVYQSIIDSVNNEFNEYQDVQEPIIYKAFNGGNITDKNLDFEIKTFEILSELAGVLDDYSKN